MPPTSRIRLWFFFMSAATSCMSIRNPEVQTSIQQGCVVALLHSKARLLFPVASKAMASMNDARLSQLPGPGLGGMPETLFWFTQNWTQKLHVELGGARGGEGGGGLRMGCGGRGEGGEGGCNTAGKAGGDGGLGEGITTGGGIGGLFTPGGLGGGTGCGGGGLKGDGDKGGDGRESAGLGCRGEEGGLEIGGLGRLMHGSKAASKEHWLQVSSIDILRPQL